MVVRVGEGEGEVEVDGEGERTMDFAVSTIVFSATFFLHHLQFFHCATFEAS